MTMKELVAAIAQKHKKSGIVINPPATEHDIHLFEHRMGFLLPPDFREFYTICNGFGCSEDIFNMTSLQEILDYKKDYGANWFSFAEYMIYSDAWLLSITPNDKYEIYNDSVEGPLTSSLHEFLERFLRGNVFDEGGLYDWHKDAGKKRMM